MSPDEDTSDFDKVDTGVFEKGVPVNSESGNSKLTLPRIDILSIAYSPNLRYLFEILPELEAEFAWAMSDPDFDLYESLPELDKVQQIRLLEDVSELTSSQLSENPFHNADRISFVSGYITYATDFKHLSDADYNSLMCAAQLLYFGYDGCMSDDLEEHQEQVDRTLRRVNLILKGSSNSRVIVPFKLRVTILLLILVSTTRNPEIKPATIPECIMKMAHYSYATESFYSFILRSGELKREYPMGQFRSLEEWEDENELFLDDYMRSIVAQVFLVFNPVDDDDLMKLLEDYEKGRQKVLAAFRAFVADRRSEI